MNTLSISVCPWLSLAVSRYASRCPSLSGQELEPSVSGRVVWAIPRDACEPITNAAQIRSSIALAVRSPPGGARRCDFADKVRALQAAGARLVVVVNNDGVDGVDDPNRLVTMTALDAAKDIVIPAIFVVSSLHTWPVVSTISLTVGSPVTELPRRSRNRSCVPRARGQGSISDRRSKPDR